MAQEFASMRNLDFLLYDVHQVSQLFEYPYYQDYNEETIRMMIDGARKICDTHLFPYYSELDRHGVLFEDGKIKVHPQVKNYMEASGESGWIGATLGYDVGGMQIPILLNSAAKFLFEAANNCITGYASLTAGAARLIESFGSSELKETYIPRMISGEWGGTMALTEAQAGSSLAYITTSASPTEEGHHKIKGQKIFISGGDYEGIDNIIHLMLARIDGAPTGTKGISLFVVPKYRFDAHQALVPNDVTTAGIFHKMGQLAYATAHLVMGDEDDCWGYLLGEPNEGLEYMFQMMNEARLGVGTSAAATASAAYYASLEYAKERPQGRRLNEKDPTLPQTMIINHPDVRRMLFKQKAIVEGALSLIFQCSLYADQAQATEGESKEKYELLPDLLTPIAKAYPSELGIESISAGLQCLGGYGYCTDFPLEQYHRDVRIMAIYEGTTGIQSLDLLGRKVLMKNGAAMDLYFQEVDVTIAHAGEIAPIKELSNKMQSELDNLKQVTKHLTGLAMQGDAELFLADANLFMELFSYVAVGWQWLKQGIVANRSLENDELSIEQRVFLESKIHTLKYFFSYEIPRTQGLTTRLMEDRPLTIKESKEHLV